MKIFRFFNMFSAFIMLFVVIVTAKTIPGDLNNDSKIDISDCMVIIKHIVNDTQNAVADANGDGIVNVRDVALVLRYIAGEKVALICDDSLAQNDSRLSEWTYTLDADSMTIQLRKYIGKAHNVYIPATFVVNGATYNTMVMTDRSAQSSPFTGSQIIRSVIFADGVAANDMCYMFRDCPHLKYINQYPEYDGEWWLGVFFACRQLVSAPKIPDDISNIRITGFFYNCSNLLGEHSLPENYNENYASNVFYNCTNINKKNNVLWFGDSITAGTSTKGESFVNYLREELSDTGIANVAVGGRTLSYGHDVDEEQLAASIVYDFESFGVVEDIDFVFVSAGTNDFAHSSSRRPYGTYRFADVGDINDVSAHTLLGAMNTIISETAKKFPNAKLIFTTPITRFNYDIDGAKASDASIYTVHLEDFVNAIKLACANSKTPYIDAYLESEMEVSNDSCDGNGDYFADQTHPTLKGQRKLADYFLEKLVSEYGFEKNNQ